MKQPEIRLKGFEGEWKSEKIGTIAPITGGYAFQSDCFVKNGVPIVRISNILDSGVVGGEFAFYDSFPGDEQFKLLKNDIVIAMSGATTGKVAIVKDDKIYYQNQRVGKFSRTGKVNYSYLSTIVSRGKFLRELYKLLTASAQPNASSRDIDSINIPLPKYENEQQAIADYFKSLDSLIQTTTKKIASLKLLKSASLVSMFPQEGETKPRVRFKGFDGEWKYIELSECLTVCKERNFSELYSKNDVLSVSDDYGVVNQIELLGRSYAGKSVANYRILRTGDVVYTKSPLKIKPFGIIKVNEKETGIVSTLYAVYSPKEGVYSRFISRYFEPAARMNKYIHPLVNKGAKNDMKVSDENVLKGKIFIPSTIKEQQKIASFFSNLDKQISIQEQRLEKLKQIKSACLDKMFV